MHLLGTLFSVFPGQKIVALIETTALVCIERFADYPQLGRFTLRDEGMLLSNPLLSAFRLTSRHPGRTIAIGKVHCRISLIAYLSDTDIHHPTGHQTYRA
jgi:Elongation factor Tu C-terminal domain